MALLHDGDGPIRRGDISGGNREARTRSTSTPVLGDKKSQWAILLPITSRSSPGNDGPSIWERLEDNAQRLVESVPLDRRNFTTVYVAIDQRDPVLDSDAARKRIRELLTGLKVDICAPLPPAYQGAICWIWAMLASRAVDNDAEFFVLLGDDVYMHEEKSSLGWQDEVETCFRNISAETGLPFGCGCVAIQDEAYQTFPTFPVMHRLHLDVFKGELFPPEFRNQHGDPFLYEIYRRWGASRYTKSAKLTNTVGGAAQPRYNKAGSQLDTRQDKWRGEVLSRAIESLADWLDRGDPEVAAAARVPCLDVVIPTYRCDESALRVLTSLRSERPVALHTTLVVDRPDAVNLDAIRRLASQEHNRTVRVCVLEENSGASWARNVGLWQSFGDHVILLDDDVIPEKGLLDAYLGALEREPGAAAYVGVTELPVPTTLVQQAMAACNICYFYGVARHQRHPPWGVTANICVPARLNPVSFDRRFPKTGGGEDVDFCIRSQQHFGKCVAVPGARVLHPYWDRPLQQVSGWADGDVLCLESLPLSTFRTTPNWVELALLSIFFQRPDLAILSVLIEVFMLMPRFFDSAAPREFLGRRLLVSLIAVFPPMLQDARRLCSKIRRMRFTHLCLHFDWMNKTGNHSTERQLTILSRTLAFCLSAAALDSEGSVRITTLICLFLFCFVWCINQADLRIIPQILKVPRPLNLDLDLGDAKVPFVVFAFQRTGSNLLCNLLGQNKQIAMHYEIFNDKAIYSHDGICNAQDEIGKRDSSPADYLRDALSITERARSEGGGKPKAVGFKVFPEHICRSTKSRELFEELLADTRVRKIILHRRNRLAVCVSALRASVTGQYIKKKLDYVRVHIEPEGLQGFIDNYDCYYSYIRERLAGQGGDNGCWMQITYEELIEDHQGTAGKIYKFLGVTPFEPRSGHAGQSQRQTNGDMSSAISNFEELRHAFSGTDRETDFYDI
eukprot:CAMPEP_0194311960 /NCGR_PEP_ID=MMETSP0171-20130528/8886_1 /TAXON_ID=218684 /ORGANISM="Corethron pennatum, Strain L29A3" /LENGTH=960 /DNA_ID=CAMNT_0039066277 /DNA_START=458 /DNA_END=3340 /DNA_ORIENTATION=-